jgi:hypothetical protein
MRTMQKIQSLRFSTKASLRAQEQQLYFYYRIAAGASSRMVRTTTGIVGASSRMVRTTIGVVETISRIVGIPTIGT